MQAIICLQSDACFEALEIDWPKIRERALEHGVVMTRVSVRDFDHNDQARVILPPPCLLRTSSLPSQTRAQWRALPVYDAASSVLLMGSTASVCSQLELAAPGGTQDTAAAACGH